VNWILFPRFSLVCLYCCCIHYSQYRKDKGFTGTCLTGFPTRWRSACPGVAGAENDNFGLRFRDRPSDTSVNPFGLVRRGSGRRLPHESAKRRNNVLSSDLVSCSIGEVATRCSSPFGPPCLKDVNADAPHCWNGPSYGRSTNWISSASPPSGFGIGFHGIYQCLHKYADTS
jgi:hypothetical protein